MTPPAEDNKFPKDGQAGEQQAKRAQKFRLKRSRSHHAERSSDDDRKRRHRHRRHHKRHERGLHSASTTEHGPACRPSVPELPPDVAFRESLFDALGDDEGAAFWEGVYGQPIHTYGNTYENADTGELEQMDEEEYASFVRRKMWEKSREGIEAAREESRRQKLQNEQRAKSQQIPYKPTEPPSHEPSFVFDMEFEQSLRRGRQRQDRKRWKGLWDSYLQKWAELQGLYEARRQGATDTGQTFLRNKIAWPVETGKRQDVSAERIEHYFDRCVDAISTSDNVSTMSAVLRSERIRWHPDKIQQRFGFMELDESTMTGVTAVFQVLDRLWNRVREEKQP